MGDPWKDTEWGLAKCRTSDNIASMRKLFLGWCLLLLSVAAQAQLQSFNIEIDGIARDYSLYVPQGVTGAAPLVVVLHGGGGTGPLMARFSRFSELADSEKFIVAYPNGLNRQWNDGRAEVGATADDVKFLRMMIAEIKSKQPVDMKHVFVTGMSNGAAMTSRMACDASDIVRAIGPVSNTMKTSMLDSCKPKHPMPVIEIHGIDDPIVPYTGGEIVVLRKKRGRVISVQQYSQFWAKLNGCSLTPDRIDLPQVTDDATSVIKDEFLKCKAPVVVYSIRGGGHAWPGGMDHRRMTYVGKMSNQIDATKLIWEFFKQTIATDKADEQAAKASADAAKQTKSRKRK